ncbi:MAG: YkvA family protein [Anaerolineae bacterium]
MRESWKRRAQALRADTYALYWAYRDPRTPWYARLFAALIVGYAFSPVDLIPDFVPVLGYADDMVLVPLGVLLALKMIPPEVWAESRRRAIEEMMAGRPVRWAIVGVVATWLLILALVAAVLWKALGS